MMNLNTLNIWLVRLIVACLFVHWANICMPPIHWYDPIREAACEDVANRFSYAICSVDQEPRGQIVRSRCFVCTYFPQSLADFLYCEVNFFQSITLNSLKH